MNFEKTVNKWFKLTGGGGLILPDRWFGRPHDNIHDITYVSERPHKLIIELDNQLMLIFTEAKKVEIIGNDLVISDFVQLTFDYQLYSSLKAEVKTYKSGEVRLVGRFKTG